MVNAHVPAYLLRLSHLMDIQDYKNLPDLALMDALTDETFQQFVTSDEVGTITINSGDINDASVQALSRLSVQNVMEKIFGKMKQAGIDIQHWIYSPEEFNLCRKIRETNIGEIKLQLHEYLKSKWTQAASVAVGLATSAATEMASASFLAIFTALGFISGVFMERCNLP